MKQRQAMLRFMTAHQEKDGSAAMCSLVAILQQALQGCRKFFDAGLPRQVGDIVHDGSNHIDAPIIQANTESSLRSLVHSICLPRIKRQPGW